MRLVLLLICTLPALADNKTAARRFIEDTWFQGNLQVIDELVAPKVVVHDIGDRKNAAETPEMQKQVVKSFRDNGTVTGRVNFLIEEADRVAVHWTWNYKSNVWWQRIMGGDLSTSVVNMFRFENGKIVEIWNHRHDIDAFEQAGFLRWEYLKGLIIGLIAGTAFSLVLRRLLRPTGAASR
ncbi:MAG: ester cyclase [Bryobacteraceae bacterium]|nr:ester cyclase [Bryobacteraceae bacterium]